MKAVQVFKNYGSSIGTLGLSSLGGILTIFSKLSKSADKHNSDLFETVKSGEDAKQELIEGGVYKESVYKLKLKEFKRECLSIRDVLNTALFDNQDINTVYGVVDILRDVYQIGIKFPDELRIGSKIIIYKKADDNKVLFKRSLIYVNDLEVNGATKCGLSYEAKELVL